MVLEVEARDVLARVGTWTGPKGPTVRLPLLLETRPSARADALLSVEGPGVEGPLLVRDLGSSFRPLHGSPGHGDWSHLEIPPEVPLPPSLADQLDEVPLTVVDGDGIVEVVHAASSRLDQAAPPDGRVEWVVMASAASLSARPDRFIDAVLAARRRAGPGRLLYLPGVATPRSLALLTYLGADVVDDVQCRLDAARGRLARPELGHVHRPGDLTMEELGSRNLDIMRQEVELVREGVDHSALRELVEVRVRSEPWQVAALRRLDRHHSDALLPYAPVHRDRPLFALTRESLGRIEVTSWVGTMLERYRPPASARVLVLLPCSARKPYSQSRSHRRMADAMAGVGNRATVLEVILTSPLGAVPRELERTYPAAHYDIPVSGDWYAEEVDRMRLLVEAIREGGEFPHVVSHMGPGLAFLEDDPSVVGTREGDEGALDGDALKRLARETAEGTSTVPKVQWRERSAEDVASLARFQFGPEAAEALMRDARVVGRYPGHKVKGPDGVQRASVVPARGRLSLTLAGAEVLASAGGNRVWMDDFELRGDLFAVGVLDVDPGLRPAEEAVVLRGDHVTGVGVARMGAIEMMASSRGVAVAMRHKRSGGGGP